MHCQNCSQELVQGAVFCGNCGAKILNAGDLQAQQAPTSAPAHVVTPLATPQAIPATQSTPTNTLAAPIQHTTVTPLQPTPTGTYAVVGAAPNSVVPTLSLIAGIIALGSFFFWPLAVLLGITAVILGIIGLTKKVHKGLSITGIILGALGIILSIVFIVAIFSYCEENPLEETCIELNSALAL